ncbi:down syndrome cell adhesion molecule-like protein Dscam2 [Trichonephila clavipes]|nr:down syndrome cell adhesion molecule-like protein Dscam2 [Trichonephila clavipes]
MMERMAGIQRKYCKFCKQKVNHCASFFLNADQQRSCLIEQSAAVQRLRGETSDTLYRDNTLLAGGQRLADHRNGTLTIAQASKGDQGWYHCEVVGGQGEKAMGSLYIRVVERPVINPFIFGDELMEGMRTMVVCTVLAGESPINILWLKDSMPLLHSEHRDGIHVTNLGEFASSLTIPSVSRYHAGNYTCLVASGAAQASFTAVMNVKELHSIHPSTAHWATVPVQRHDVRLTRLRIFRNIRSKRNRRVTSTRVTSMVTAPIRRLYLQLLYAEDNI